MVSRPTVNKPDWATAGTCIEPSSGKKASGWLINERLPAEWQNWLENSISQWLSYLGAALDGTSVDDMRISWAQTNATIPLIDVTSTADAASSTYKLLERFALASNRHASFYVGGSSAARRFVLVHNAVWNGTQWAPEDTAQVHSAIALRADTSGQVIELLRHAASSSPWNDSAWSAGSLGDVTAGNITAASVTAPNMSATTGLLTPLVTAGSMSASGTVFCTGDISGGSVHVRGPHLYLDPSADVVYDAAAATQPVRWVTLPPQDAIILTATDFLSAYDVLNGYWVSGSSADLTLEWAIKLPRFVTQWNVRAMWMAPDSAHANAFSVVRTDRDLSVQPSATPPGIVNLANVGQTFYSATLPKVQGTASPITDTIDNNLSSYSLHMVIKANAAGTNRLYAVQVGYSDPGARNG